MKEIPSSSEKKGTIWADFGEEGSTTCLPKVGGTKGARISSFERGVPGGKSILRPIMKERRRNEFTAKAETITIGGKGGINSVVGYPPIKIASTTGRKRGRFSTGGED